VGAYGKKKVLIQSLNSKEYDRLRIGVLIRDAKMLARLNFNSVSFIFCRRSCNKVVHAMAALGSLGNHGNSLLWLDDVPDNVRVIVASESAMPMF
jgi:hypothetical protein